jgi:glycosyltransferase involved in cell wall biosynthesis
LDIVVRNKIEFFDEIVLVDNNSDDNTWDICKRLYSEFPKKIKIYQYEPVVFKLRSTDYDSVNENSVHCNSYYYNRCFSKANYKFLLKIDDDNLFDPDVLKEIRSTVLSGDLKKIYLLPGLNVIETKKMILSLK